MLFDPDPSATVFVGHFFVWLCVLGGFFASGEEGFELSNVAASTLFAILTFGDSPLPCLYTE